MTKSLKKQKHYEQVAAALRQRVLAGLDQGQVVELPPQRDLCHEMSVSITTVRRAVKLLEDEGLITTRHGSGSVLSEKLLAGKKTIAMVVGYWRDSHRLSSWHPQVLGEACQLLEENGWQIRVYTLFHGNMKRDERVMDQLWADATNRRFVGLISFPDKDALRQGFTKLLRERSIYCIAFDANDQHNNILLDYAALGMMGANELLRQGARRIGIIGVCASMGGGQPLGDLNGAKQAVANHPGAEICPEWCIQTVPTIGSGTAAFKQIWAQQQRPDGLIVSDEFAYYGVVLAMLELGVRYPQDIALVAQLTEGAPIDTLYQPPRLVFSPRMMAWQLFSTLTGMIRERLLEIPSVRLSPKLVPTSTGTATAPTIKPQPWQMSTAEARKKMKFVNTPAGDCCASKNKAE